MLIQVNLTEKQNETISIYKIKNKLKTKAEAIKKLLDECGAKDDNSAQTNIPADRQRDTKDK